MDVSSSPSSKSEKKKKNRTKPKTYNKKMKTPSNSDAAATRMQRTNSREVRLNRGRIYDSQNGKTCHQCRKTIMDFVVSCKKKTENKQCAIHFCHRCLLNRYGSKAEEVTTLHNWTCPRCRGICNCSFCMKKRGHHHTGLLVHVGKASGFPSVSEMLPVKDSGNPGSKGMKDADGSSKKRKASNEESDVSLAKRHREGNDFQRPHNAKLLAQPSGMHDGRMETRSRKLLRLGGNNGNDNASIEKNDSDSIAKDSSPKRRQISKAGNSFQKPSNSEVRWKTSKVGGIGVETRNSKLKRLEDNKDAASLIQKCSTKRYQTFKESYRVKEKKFRRNVGDQLINMNSDMEVSGKDFQESINGRVKIEVPNSVDVKDNLVRHGRVKGSQYEKNIVKVKRKLSNVEIPLPHGIILSNVASIDIPAEDVGHAFQFLEFCKTFAKILNLRKGQSEHFLRELACGRSKRRAHSSPIVKFHIKLLSVIEKDSRKEYPYFQNLGENSWFQALVKYISESCSNLNELQVDCFEEGNYDLLDISKKLKLLNFLCNEALGTTDFRNWMDEQSKFVERDQKGKEKVLAEKEKKNMKNKKQHDEIDKAVVMKNGALRVAQTLRNTMEASEVMVNAEPRSGALRSEPMFLDEHGRKFWRLRCFSGEMNILLQDIEKGDPRKAKERWYSYGIEQKAMVEKYICSFRKLGT